jgi:hypothetical protein
LVAERRLGSAPANRAILTAQGDGLASWNKNWSAMTGSILPAAYTARSARNIRIGSLPCVMHKAVYWLTTMGPGFRQPQRQLGEIDCHTAGLVAG